MVDLSSVGAAHRTEAEKLGHRAIFFAAVSVLAHLLDIRPSEIESAGIKFALKDPVVIYGAIAMVFGYYISRFINESERATAFLSLEDRPRRIRANIRNMKCIHRATKEGRSSPQTPRRLKLSVQRVLLFTDLILFPYRLTAGLFVAAAIVFMFMDLVGLAEYIWGTSPLISGIVKFVTEP